MKKGLVSLSPEDYNARYQFIRKQKSYTFGDCSLIKDKKFKQPILAREKIVRSEDELQNKLQYCELLLALNECASAVQFLGCTFKETPHLGENTWNFVELRELTDSNLEKEMAARLINKDVFSEDDMWTMTYQLVSMLAKLQSCNIAHERICPEFMTIIRGDVIQAKLHWSDSYASAYNLAQAGEFPAKGKCYLAPELLANLLKPKKKFTYNKLYADAFSLGITLLSACTLGDVADLYNLQTMTFDFKLLKSKLDWLKNIYSERLFILLDRMLRSNPEERKDFIALENLMFSIEQPGSFSQGTQGSPPKRTNRSLSPEAKTMTTTGFEIQKMRVLEAKKLNSTLSGTMGSPTSTRNTARSPDRSPEMSPLLLKQKTDSTITSIFDKTMSPLEKEGFVAKDILLPELEKKFLQDPQTQMLKTGMTMQYYSDGARFEGCLKMKLREKIGINYYNNGDVYAGEWKKDKFHGRGIYFFANGDRYEGQLEKGWKHGQGIFYFGNKGKYMGEWKNDKKHGGGVFFYYSTKESYEGEWANGMKHGEGTFHYASGDKYVGSWANDKRSGKGVLTCSLGGSYEGEWANDKPNGVGVMIYPNGEKYEGHWEDGMKSGEGTYSYNNGSRYEGEWKDDEKNGQGTLLHQKGEKYSGEWKDGLKHGEGTYYYPNGSIYQGQWENDIKQGFGAMLMPDGSNYQGDWVANERSGNGVVTLKNGDTYDGKFVKGKMTGTGVYHWRNGDTYEGQWDNNKAHGKGKFVRKNGDKIDGVWDAQKLVKVIGIPEGQQESK